MRKEIKKLLVLTMILIICGVVGISLTACDDGGQITLNLAFGDITGTYSGDVKRILDCQDGYGKFTAKNDEGEEWTYEGEF